MGDYDDILAGFKTPGQAQTAPASPAGEYDDILSAFKSASSPAVKMGGSPPVGFVASQVSKLAPWNRAYGALRDGAGYLAEKMGGAGVPPVLAAALTTPIAIAPDILAAGLLEPKIPAAIEPAIKNIANEASFRTLGGRVANARELGPTGTRALGEFGLKSGIIGYGADGMLTGVDKVIAESGKALEGLRFQADLAGGPPHMADMVGRIRLRLGPKYASGVESGGQTQFNNAIDELLKANPQTAVTEGEAVASQMKGASPFSAVRPKNVNRLEARTVGKMPGYEPTAKAYRNARVMQEQGIPEYPTSEHQPTFSDYAGRATRLNQYAKKQAGLLQDRTPATDVANVLSEENNAGILKALGPEKFAEYQRQLRIFENASKAKAMILNKSAREVAGRSAPFGAVQGVYQYAKDKLWDPSLAKGLHTLTEALGSRP